MKKKSFLIILISTIIIGALITFYATNLLFSDVGNMFYGIHDAYFVSTIPMLMISIDFSVAVIFELRLFRYPQYKKKIINLYSIYLMANSIVAIIFVFLTSKVYNSFLEMYPFPYYCVIMLIINLGLFILGLLVNLKNRKRPEDEEKKAIKFKYVIYSIFLGCMLYFAVNKLGAFLWSPLYIQYRSLYLTFPLYLYLLLPMSLVIHVIIYFLDGYIGKEKRGIIYLGVIIGLNLVLGLAVFITGFTNSLFSAAVSPALPLERLASMPIHAISSFILINVLGVYYLIYQIITYKKSR